MRKGLEKKSKIGSKCFDIVIEDIKATSPKVKRFTEKSKQYRKNRMFINI